MEKTPKNTRLNEIRRPRKCDIIDWAPLEESVEFKDMIGMGWQRVTTYGREKQGNLVFFHPELEDKAGSGYPQFKINHHGGNKETAHLGTIMVLTGENTSFEINAQKKDYLKGEHYRDHKHLSKICATWEDYIPKMNYLMKALLKKEGFPVNDKELYGKSSYAELILAKVQKDAGLYNKLSKVPPSLKGQLKSGGIIKRLKLFGGDKPEEEEKS